MDKSTTMQASCLTLSTCATDTFKKARCLLYSYTTQIAAHSKSLLLFEHTRTYMEHSRSAASGVESLTTTLCIRCAQYDSDNSSSYSCYTTNYVHVTGERMHGIYRNQSLTRTWDFYHGPRSSNDTAYLRYTSECS